MVQPDTEKIDSQGASVSAAASPVTLRGKMVVTGAFELESLDDLVIEGNITCDTVSGVRNLSIPVTSVLNGNVHSNSADIAGIFIGAAEIDGIAIVRRTASICGQLTADVIKVEEGTNLENCVLSGKIQSADS